jgi:membrane protease YdiL (CAAX protease family)
MGMGAKATRWQTLSSLFYGPIELRVGWRLLIFVVIVLALMFAKAALIRKLHISGQEVSYLLDKVLKFAVFLLASWIMAKIEARTIADYGLPWRKMFGHSFWKGAAMALLGLTGFLALLRFAGLFRFGEIALRGSEIWKWGALFGFGLIVVALEEEFHYRGYGLATLAKGVGFWPAAIVSSAAFGYSHIGNAGENWLGLFNAGAGGLLFCFLLRRSGDLWMPIGFHASFGWAQTYLYGVPNSGHILPGHLLNGNFFGPRWLTGGTVGPEGSVLLTLLLILFWLSVSASNSLERSRLRHPHPEGS